jgi:hypothetical protein
MEVEGGKVVHIPIVHTKHRKNKPSEIQIVISKYAYTSIDRYNGDRLAWPLVDGALLVVHLKQTHTTLSMTSTSSTTSISCSYLHHVSLLSLGIFQLAYTHQIQDVPRDGHQAAAASSSRRGVLS